MKESIVALPDGACVYALVNTVTKQMYIGASTDWKQRVASHLSQLRCGRHIQPRLQKSFNGYGAAAFDVWYLTSVPQAFMFQVEAFAIEKLTPSKKLFNPSKRKSCEVVIHSELIERSLHVVEKLELWLSGEDRWSDERIPLEYRGRWVDDSEKLALSFSSSEVRLLQERAIAYGLQWKDYVELVVKSPLVCDHKIVKSRPKTESEELVDAWTHYLKQMASTFDLSGRKHIRNVCFEAKASKQLDVVVAVSLIVISNGDVIKDVEVLSGVTLNQAYIIAAIKVAKRFLEFYKDSKKPQMTFQFSNSYLKDGATKWMETWKKKGWTSFNGEPVANHDLWKQLDSFSHPSILWRDMPDNCQDLGVRYARVLAGMELGKLLDSAIAS